MQAISTRPVLIGSAVSVAAVAAFALASRRRRDRRQHQQHGPPIPRSVNWHFTRQCNYGCQFCFHTAKASYVMPVKDMALAKRGLALLREQGMEKMNFSGGEPFLHKKQLGELVRYCKEDLRLISVSIVTNGSLVDRKWMEAFGRHLDILAVSCDSFDADVLRSFGRCTKAGVTDHIDQTKQVRDWCEDFGVVFKMNTVVTAKNAHEDMTHFVRELRPKRWKVFQALLLTGENTGENETGRDARHLEIPHKVFQAYIARHHADEEVARVLVPESNAQMRDSYLILDERMRFLDCSTGSKTPGRSIFEDGGVIAALLDAGHDEAMFYERGGEYEWRKEKILDVEDLVDSCSSVLQLPSITPLPQEVAAEEAATPNFSTPTMNPSRLNWLNWQNRRGALPGCISKDNSGQRRASSLTKSMPC